MGAYKWPSWPPIKSVEHKPYSDAFKFEVSEFAKDAHGEGIKIIKRYMSYSQPHYEVININRYASWLRWPGGSWQMFPESTLTKLSEIEQLAVASEFIMTEFAEHAESMD